MLFQFHFRNSGLTRQQHAVLEDFRKFTYESPRVPSLCNRRVDEPDRGRRNTAPGRLKLFYI